MTRLIVVAFLCLCRIQADDLARVIPPNAKWITGVDTSRLRATPRWPILLDLAQVAKRFGEMVSAAGFDPSADLDEVVLANVEAPAYGDLVILRGRFDSSRVASFDPRNPEGHETRYRGVRVCAPLERSGNYLQWTASVADLVLIGPDDAVRAAIDGWLEEEPTPKWFAAKLARHRGRRDAWVVGRQHTVDDGDNPRRPGLEWTIGIRLEPRPEMEAEGVAANAEDARIAGHRLRESIAHDWRAGLSPLWKSAAESLRISVDGRAVRLAGEMDWEPWLVLAARSPRFTALSPSDVRPICR